jgi:hypothetical protein
MFSDLGKRENLPFLVAVEYKLAKHDALFLESAISSADTKRISNGTVLGQLVVDKLVARDIPM